MASWPQIGGMWPASGIRDEIVLRVQVQILCSHWACMPGTGRGDGQLLLDWLSAPEVIAAPFERGESESSEEEGIAEVTLHVYDVSNNEKVEFVRAQAA